MLTKKLSVLALFLLLLPALAACGTEATPVPTAVTAPTNTTAPAAPTDTTAPPTTAPENTPTEAAAASPTGPTRRTDR